MVQLKHHPQTVEKLLRLHKGLTEKLDWFRKNQPGFIYDISLLIGEKNHVIIVNMDFEDAERTGPGTEEAG